MAISITEAILAAKLGRTRKDAQIDCCDVFAAALYDVLKAQKIPARLYSAEFRHTPTMDPEWFHAAVRSENIYYDSLGAFSLETIRARYRISPKSRCTLTFKANSRNGFFEPESAELHAFYVRELTKAFNPNKKPKKKVNPNGSDIAPHHDRRTSPHTLGPPNS